MNVYETSVLWGLWQAGWQRFIPVSRTFARVIFSGFGKKHDKSAYDVDVNIFLFAKGMIVMHH